MQNPNKTKDRYRYRYNFILDDEINSRIDFKKLELGVHYITENSSNYTKLIPYCDIIADDRVIHTIRCNELENDNSSFQLDFINQKAIKQLHQKGIFFLNPKPQQRTHS